MMTQTTESPKLRFRADDGSEFPKWKSMPMRSLFSEVIEKNHPEYPVLSIRQGCGTILRDSSDRNIEYDKSNLTNYKVIEKGDFIIHLRSFEGGLECSALQGISSPAYRILRSDCIIPEAYKDYFRSHEFINHRLSEAVVGIRDGKNIDMNIFWEIKVPYMALPEQQKIADFLSAYDKKIFLQKVRVETLKEQKKGLLQKMFPKKGETVPELRFPGFTGDWEQRKFSEIAQRQSETMVSDDDNPCVEYEDVIVDQGTLNKDIFAKGVYKNGIKFTSKDVLYGKLRPYLHNWLNPDFSGVAVGDWWVLRPIDTDKNFLFRLLQTSKYDDAANQSSGTKMPRADWKLISNLEFEIPATIEEQEKISRVFDNLDNLITLHQRKLETMQEIKKGLLQQLFC